MLSLHRLTSGVLLAPKSTLSLSRRLNAFLTPYVCIPNDAREVGEYLTVVPNFVSSEEEKTLVDEIEKTLGRKKYEYDHWDNTIHGYRETEIGSWRPCSAVIVQRVKKVSFAQSSKPLTHTHVLDLAEKGIIKPHIDSVKFCGPTIAGLSLLSTRVMRLESEQDATKDWIEVLLEQRSLYILRGPLRYNYTHAILDSTSSFKNNFIPNQRRISLIFREEPDK